VTFEGETDVQFRRRRLPTFPDSSLRGGEFHRKSVDVNRHSSTPPVLLIVEEPTSRDVPSPLSPSIRSHPHVFAGLGATVNMSLTADDFERYLREDDESLGDALRLLAVDIETDAVAEVRDLRERT